MTSAVAARDIAPGPPTPSTASEEPGVRVPGVPVPGVPVPGARPGDDGDGAGRGRRWLRPGWPLVAIFVPFPLWWAMGLAEWICVVLAVPMVVHLLRRRTIEVPRGFGWWLLFLLWVAVGCTLLRVDAYGAVADNSSTRYITWGYRLLWYVVITVALLYVINTRREFSTTRVVRAVAAMFITVTLGGVLGVVAPYFQFQSLMELVLPHGVTGIQFVQKMIHPQAAELQRVLGYVSPRPSAPFAFTNTWGLNYALTLPFFLLAWCGKDAGWRRWAAVPILLVAAVPCIYSINRGMWGALVAMALFVAVRAALTGRPAMLGGLVAGGVAVVMLLAVTPLGNVVTARFTNEGSETGRTNLGTLTIESVARTSPLVGLGSTRNVQGNFNSITGGSTAQCPRCSPPALGTQGQIWLVSFSQGLVGFGFFIVFFALMFLRHIRLRSPAATVGLAVLVTGGVTMFVYNSLGVGLMIVMIAIGVLVREALDEEDAGRAGVARLGVRGPTTTVDRYAVAVRSGLPVVLACGGCGVLVGAFWALYLHERPYTATMSLVLPNPPRYPTVGDGPMTIDTYGQLLASDAVVSAAATASRQAEPAAAAGLKVKATPNTRVLHLSLTARSPADAQAGVVKAIDAFLDARQRRLKVERDTQLGSLRRQADAVALGISAIDSTLAGYADRGVTSRSDDRVRILKSRRSELQVQAQKVSKQSARILAVPITAGRAITATKITRSDDVIKIGLVSGLTGGTGAGAALVLLWGAAGPRLRRVDDVHLATGLALLSRVPYPPSDQVLADVLGQAVVVSYVSVDEDDPQASGLAHLLSERAGLQRADPAAGTVLVASDRTRTDAVRASRAFLELRGEQVLGALVATRPPAAGRRWSPSWGGPAARRRRRVTPAPR